MKYDYGNQYENFSEDIDEQFPEPLLDELVIHVFVDVKSHWDIYHWAIFSGGINTHNMVIKTTYHGAKLNIWC